jgi:hypothetical protein
MPELTCASPQLSNNPIVHLVPLYKSEADWYGVKVKFKNSDYVQYNCDDKNHCQNDVNAVIEVKSAAELTYTKNGVVAKFTCQPYKLVP